MNSIVAGNRPITIRFGSRKIENKRLKSSKKHPNLTQVNVVRHKRTYKTGDHRRETYVCFRYWVHKMFYIYESKRFPSRQTNLSDSTY